MNPEDSAYFPCDVCLEDTEHNLSEYDDWECAECGAVLDNAVFRRFLYRSGLLVSQRLHSLYPPGVSGEPFEEGRIFPVRHKRPGERLL